MSQRITILPLLLKECAHRPGIQYIFWSLVAEHRENYNKSKMNTIQRRENEYLMLHPILFH
jgi:hypothetical protein